MGFLVNNFCYSDSAIAADAYYSSFPASTTVAVDGSSSVMYYRKSGASWFKTVWTYNPAGAQTSAVTTAVPVASFPACDHLQSFNDGLIVGGLLLLAVISAVVFGIISKAR